MRKEETRAPRMDLILWRHAEAEEGSATLADAKRRLTARGEKQAKLVAGWLAPRLPKEVRILASPTERTRMTAQALGLPFASEPGIGPEADAGDVLAAAAWPEAGGTVLVVGHQPTLGRVAARLLTGSDSDWAIKKGALWWFSGQARGGEARAALKAVIGADMLQR